MSSSSTLTHVQCGRRRLDLSAPVVMGVLNVTPDSFSDGGRFVSRDKAVAHALRMCEQGAAILDIGGESTRPGADDVPVDREMERVIPVVEALRGQVDAVISIDTSKPEVMRAAVAAGAELINDVAALRIPGALETAAGLNAGVCLMHMQGTPRTMQANPSYENVVAEVYDFLDAQVTACVEAGIDRERIVVDPGFGFGKTLEHNLELLRGMGRLRELNVPVLAGLSRKSFVGKITGGGKDNRTHSSVAFAISAVCEGASILRVHDVEATVHALRVWRAVYGGTGIREHRGVPSSFDRRQC